jgi:hypothetical protein
MHALPSFILMHFTIAITDREKENETFQMIIKTGIWLSFSRIFVVYLLSTNVSIEVSFFGNNKSNSIGWNT